MPLAHSIFINSALLYHNLLATDDIHALPVLPVLNSAAIEVVSRSIRANLGAVVHLHASYSLLRAPILVEVHTNVVRARFLGLGVCFFIVKL